MEHPKVILVSCVSKKRAIATKEEITAQDLYCSTWFHLAREYAEQQSVPWFILSAKHGLLNPNQKIKVYNETLIKQPKLQRQE